MKTLLHKLILDSSQQETVYKKKSMKNTNFKLTTLERVRFETWNPISIHTVPVSFANCSEWTARKFNRRIVGYFNGNFRVDV